MIESDLDVSNPHDLAYRAKIYFQYLKQHLLKRASDMRSQGKVADRLTYSSTHLLDSVARETLKKAFQPYTGADDGKSRKRVLGVTFPDFAR
jgi:hypothetical protein